MNTYSVNMSVEQTLMLQISKNTASNEDDVKEAAEAILRESSGLQINNKLAKMKDSLEHDDTVIDIHKIEDCGDHFKVGANYLESFYLNIKGTDSTIAERAESIVSGNSIVSHQGGVRELMTKYLYLTSSELEKEDIALSYS